MDVTKVYSLLENHLPLPALDYCMRLWESHPFDLKLRKARTSKVGDFTCRKDQNPRITINKDLHPYLFLMTYVHEVAHLKVHLSHGFRIEAHGEEWKSTFQQLFLPLLDPVIFPDPLLQGLKKHMASPKASSYSDTDLMRLFRLMDQREAQVVLLSQIPEGSIFGLNGRWFKKGKVRRTRVLCQELKSKKQYLVPADIGIQNAQLAFL